MRNYISNAIFLLLVLILFCQHSFASETTFDASSLYEKIKPSICALLSLDSNGEEVAFGSGFVISNDGRIVTNAHVISGANKMVVECNSQKGNITKIVAYKEGIDLVILQSNLSNTTPLKIISRDKLKPGGLIFAIGNPLGLQGTITSGLFSGIRAFEENDYLQISANINPGNSGGAVVTTTAEVVGVATMHFANTQGLSFAIPADLIPNLPQVELSISSLDIEQFERGQLSSPLVSELTFLGLPLGADCKLIQTIKDITELKGLWVYRPNKTVTADEISGKYFLFGKAVDVLFVCRFGKIAAAGYINMPWAILDRVKMALKEKYGNPQGSKDISVPSGSIENGMERLGNIIEQNKKMIEKGIPLNASAWWELGNGKLIALSRDYESNKRESRYKLMYKDLELLKNLEKKEVLKAISENKF